MLDTKSHKQGSTREPAADLPIEAIREAIESIRFGTVQIIIQDGRIVQIDKTEKMRLA
jgi:hypothetical protein